MRREVPVTGAGEQTSPQMEERGKNPLAQVPQDLLLRASTEPVELSDELQAILQADVLQSPVSGIGEMVQRVLAQIRGDLAGVPNGGLAALAAQSLVASSSAAASFPSVATSSPQPIHAAAALQPGFERTTTVREMPKPMSSADTARTLKRVQEALEEAAKSRDGKQISLRLDPPNLGKVNVDVTLRDGTLHARLFAEQAQVSQMLREKAHELQRMLRDLGLHVDEIRIAVSTEESFDSLTGGFSERQSRRRQDSETVTGESLGAGVVVDETGEVTGAPVEEHGWVA